MVKLKRLKINKYRNVRPGTELRFDDGFNLLLGRNGSGKTTLLGLVHSAFSLDFTAIENELFDLEIELRNDNTRLVLHLKSLGYLSEVAGDAPEPSQLPNLEFTATVTLLADDRSTVFDSTTSETKLISPVLSLPSAAGTVSFRRGFLTRAMTAIYSNCDASDEAYEHIDDTHSAVLEIDYHQSARFDEGLDNFLAMTGRPPVSVGTGTPSPARFSLSHRESLPPRFRARSFTPRLLVNIVPKAHESPGGEIILRRDQPPPQEDGTAFLHTAASLLGATEASLKPEIRAIDRKSPKTTVYEVQGFSFSFTRPEGLTIHHDLLSYGQKRLLSFFYYLAAIEDIVIADELVNGLHHKWIEACMDAIGDRQAFLTSQNPLLFDYIPDFESAEQVQSRFITCKTELVEGTEQLVWQNMPMDDAERMFESYQAEIQSVGEILITRGLW